MANSTIKKGVKIDQIALSPQNVNSGSAGTFALPSPYSGYKIMDIIPISVNPQSTWSANCPATFSGIGSDKQSVTIRSFYTQAYAPIVSIIYE